MYDDYRDYFFASLGKTPGTDASDWKATLENATRMTPPYGVNPQPGQVQPLNAPHHGITIMLGADGGARGRLWLPTDLPVYDGNGNAWFTHEMQVIADGPFGGLVWAWDDKGGAPVRRFMADTAPVPVPPTPPSGGGVTPDEVAAMIRAALVGYIESGTPVSLAIQEWNGQPAMQVAGDRDQAGTPLLGNRPEGSVGPWETFTIREAK